MPPKKKSGKKKGSSKKKKGKKSGASKEPKLTAEEAIVAFQWVFFLCQVLFITLLLLKSLVDCSYFLGDFLENRTL